jgi:hypothetical protein
LCSTYFITNVRLYPFCCTQQPQRRKVSVEGEKVAKRVVEGTGGAGESSDGFAMHEHDEIQDYYR